MRGENWKTHLLTVSLTEIPERGHTHTHTHTHKTEEKNIFQEGRIAVSTPKGPTEHSNEKEPPKAHGGTISEHWALRDGVEASRRQKPTA